MFTRTDQLDIIKEETGLSDAASIIKFNRDLNRGGARFIAGLGREFNRKSRVTNLVASTQYYQIPEDSQRITLVIATSGGYNIPLTQIADEESWRLFNMTSTTGQPTHFFVRGFDEIGIYPIPASSVTAGLEIVFGPRSAFLRGNDIDDTTTSTTVTVSNGSQTVTSSGTPFTSILIGRGFEVTDGTDTRWYRIKAVPTTSTLTLENYYQGTSGSAKTFRIGDVMDIPDEYLEVPAYWAIYRFWKRRGDTKKADIALAEFRDGQSMCRESYATQTNSNVVNASEYVLNRAFSSFRGDSPTSTTT
jgi:hypothetical protein